MHPKSFAAFVLALAALVLTFGCSRSNQNPQLLTVLDLTPREVDLGDRLEVIGVGFPEGKNVRVVFRGTLNKPGSKPQENFETEVEATSVSGSRISFPFTEGLQGSFAGAGENAAHTTFDGDVIISFPSANNAPPVEGTIKSISLDVRAPSTTRSVMQARENEGSKLLEFMGITLADAQPNSGGLVIKEVKDGSLAKGAGLVANDILTSFDGVRVFSRADLRPSGASRKVNINIRSANGQPREIKEIDLQGFKSAAPADLLGAAIVLLVAALILFIFMAPTAGIITWVERRVSGRMQSRIGPNRTGPQGFLQWIADGIKSIMKEDIIPSHCDRPLFRLAPYLVFVGVSATFVVMPFGQHLIAADLDIGILFVVAVTSLVTIGLMTGGWASNNKWSLLGGIRSAAQIISYEIPGAVAIGCVVMMTGSLRLQDIIRAQGGEPWNWYMFRSPITFILFFLYFTTALAEGNRAPFDLPEAESELVAGYSTEYSGMRYVFFFFAEWANVFVMSGIASALFIGGWQVPFISASQQSASFLLQALGAFVFLTKAWILIFIVIWIRWTLPRVRIDQMMNLCWKLFVPASFAAFLLTALWLLWNPSDVLRSAISLATFGAATLLTIQFFRRVLFNLRTMQADIHVNPFI